MSKDSENILDLSQSDEYDKEINNIHKSYQKKANLARVSQEVQMTCYDNDEKED